MVLPLLLLITFSGIEYSRRFKVHQVLLSISKEIANGTFRTCWNLDSSGAQTTQCLQDELSSINSSGAFANFSLPNVRIMATLWECSPLPNADPIRLGSATLPVNSSVVSHYTATNFSIGLKNMCRQHKRFVIGEAYSTYNSLFPSMVPAINSSGDLYAVSIF